MKKLLAAAAAALFIFCIPCTYSYAVLGYFNFTLNFTNAGIAINSGTADIYDGSNTLVTSAEFSGGTLNCYVPVPEDGSTVKDYTVIIKPKSRLSIKITNITSNASQIKLTNTLRQAVYNKQLSLDMLNPGDVNGDNNINVEDVANILLNGNYAENISDAANGACDVNSDEVIDISDITVCLNSDNYGKTGELSFKMQGNSTPIVPIG